MVQRTWCCLSFAALILVACTRTQVDLPATAPAEPVTVTANDKGFVGLITIDATIVAVPRLHETIEPRMRGALAEAQVMSMADVRARGVESAEGYFFKATWTASAASDRYLNVRGEIATYTGGAHGMVNFDTFVWDRLGQRRIALADLLIDPHPGSPGVVALATAARDAVIAVKAARSADYDATKDSFIGTGAQGPFAPDTAGFGRNFQLAAAGSDGTGGGLTLIYAPYDVGPYSDGTYEVTVPAAIVVPLVKPDVARLLQ